MKTKILALAFGLLFTAGITATSVAQVLNVPVTSALVQDDKDKNKKKTTKGCSDAKLKSDCKTTKSCCSSSKLKDDSSKDKDKKSDKETKSDKDKR